MLCRRKTNDYIFFFIFLVLLCIGFVEGDSNLLAFLDRRVSHQVMLVEAESHLRETWTRNLLPSFL